MKNSVAWKQLSAAYILIGQKISILSFSKIKSYFWNKWSVDVVSLCMLTDFKKCLCLSSTIIAERYMPDWKNIAKKYNHERWVFKNLWVCSLAKQIQSYLDISLHCHDLLVRMQIPGVLCLRHVVQSFLAHVGSA